MTEFSLQQSFDRHAANYAARVTDRERYAYLDVEDELIASFMRRHWHKEEGRTLLDAACGTGDRLRMLFEADKLSQKFSEIIGLDYAPHMLEVAAKQRFNEQALYTDLVQANLLNDLDRGIKSDLTLCLWEVTNSNGRDASQLVNTLADTLNNEGYLIYDALTVAMAGILKAQEAAVLSRMSLTPSTDPQQFWYAHEDGTIAYERLFRADELNTLIQASGLTTIEAWGYHQNELLPYQLQINDNHLNEVQASEFASILIFQQN